MQKATYHSTEILHLAGIIPQVLSVSHEIYPSERFAFSEASDASPFLQKVKNSEGIHLVPTLRESGKAFHS